MRRNAWPGHILTDGEIRKSDLPRSHEELRAALRVAGKEIRKFNFGRRDTPVLKLLRRVLREARAVAATEQVSKEKG